jgi:putative membrane protein
MQQIPRWRGGQTFGHDVLIGNRARSMQPPTVDFTTAENGMSAKLSMAVTVMALAMNVAAADKMSNEKSDVRPDAAFVTEASQASHAEVAHGKLAQQNAASPAVKEFAQRMVTDHSKSGAELGAIAKKLNMKVPGDMSDKQKAEHKKLAALKGAKFDEEYIQHMVHAHESAVSLFQKQAKNGEAKELRSFAEKALPTIEEHLKMSRALKDGDRKK